MEKKYLKWTLFQFLSLFSLSNVITKFNNFPTYLPLILLACNRNHTYISFRPKDKVSCLIMPTTRDLALNLKLSTLPLYYKPLLSRLAEMSDQIGRNHGRDTDDTHILILITSEHTLALLFFLCIRMST